MKNVSKIITAKTGNDGLVSKLQQLSGSELNSILLEVFRQRAADISPADVQTQFEKNRFVTPSTLDTVAFKELELDWLKFIESKNFAPIILSPLAPLGACSSFKTVDQNNIVSALRGTEVMSDATNVFALLMAQGYKKTKNRLPMKYATSQRLVRGQGLSNPGHSAHFGIFCMATGGFNNGGLLFEMEQLLDHLTSHLSLLAKAFNKEYLTIKILLKEQNELLSTATRIALKNISEEYATDFIQQEQPNNYYNLLQFKVFLKYKEADVNVSDGGFVDWTQQLLSNKKHRLLISGIGIELVYKMMMGLI